MTGEDCGGLVEVKIFLNILKIFVILSEKRFVIHIKIFPMIISLTCW